ncbi:MAG TPA: biotin--[acetyl-CoA-carboxylase] ligase [Verrucomicrobiales bacterium]|nr:biotin--[acetyl-CoA-carboxylase] ligase [Verrucomicrobiales bacterium]
MVNRSLCINPKWDREEGCQGRCFPRGHLGSGHRALGALGSPLVTTDAAILNALRQFPGAGVSGAALSAQLGISRAAIWARIEELRRLGYEIDASPHSGYRLIAVPDALHGDDLLTRLRQPRVVGREIHVFRETTSTNDVVERMARDGLAEGVVVFAESQTRGRGRLSRRWVSSAGKGLWLSVLLRPRLQPLGATRITIAAATSLVRAVRRVVGLETEIKWPNDVLVRGRKIAGILTELAAEVDSIKHLVLGMGVNANQSASDFPAELKGLATSLRLEAGAAVDRPALAAAILEELELDYSRICDGRFDEVAAEWEQGCSTLGRPVRIQVGDRIVQGRAEALDPEGALLVRTHHGNLERVLGGDVTVLK